MDYANLLEIAVVALYFVGALLFPAGMLGQRPVLKRVGSLCAAGGLALHTLEIALLFAAGGHAAFLQGGLYYSLMAWLLLVVYFGIWWRKRLEFLALAASPLALVLYLSSITIPAGKAVTMPEHFAGLFFTLHIGALLCSLTLLAMAFAAGALFLHMERKIKTKEKLTGFRKDLPSLNTLDLANKWAVIWGFPLYSLGLLSGFIWGRYTWGRLITWDPKEITSLCIWVLYAYLFHQRLTLGWRGRKAATLGMLVFALSMLSLVMVNFLVPSHHNFQ
jgi:ABC-type transport system involved in cytochrome c biogenesis permease subunit